MMQSRTTIRIPMEKLEVAIPILEITLGVQIEQSGSKLILK